MTTLDTYRITTETYEQGWIWKIEVQDPIYFKWHDWKESDEVYMSSEEAQMQGERYYDNWEPDEQLSRESDERMSLSEQMAEFQKLK